jgi:photosystem II PsbZ protein
MSLISGLLFNLALTALVVLSFAMVVGVPVAYASPQSWDRSKQLLWLGSIAWGALVIVVGVLNFLVV